MCPGRSFLRPINFDPCPWVFKEPVSPRVGRSMQHALQASKTDDSSLKNSIREAKNAIEAKKLARVIKVIQPVPSSKCRLCSP